MPEKTNPEDDLFEAALLKAPGPERSAFSTRHVVYLAERERPVRRRMAVKVIKRLDELRSSFGTSVAIGEQLWLPS